MPGLRVEFYIKTGIVLLGAGVAADADRLGGSGGDCAGGHRVAGDVRRHLLHRREVGSRPPAGRDAGNGRRGLRRVRRHCDGGRGGREEGARLDRHLPGDLLGDRDHLPAAAGRARLGLPTGVAGAWIGTSEFADAAGLAAAQTYGGYAGHVPGITGTADAAVNSFTLMKVIGRDVWIGVWAFVLAIVATTRWERTGIESKPNAGEIWKRFPKFVLGFLIASAIVTIVSHGYTYADYKKVLQPSLVAPLQALRTWAFTFAFLAIGLTTRFREFVSVGSKPFYAFTDRRRGQHRTGLRPLDAGVRGLLDQAGPMTRGDLRQLPLLQWGAS